MKILCLHGKGTSDKIFESQTQAFRALLPSHYTYDFLPGEHPMTTYPQISDFFPGPYLCYHTTNTMEKVEEAMKYVGEVVEDEGPFDGVMGFSQGAALAAAILLTHQHHFPLSPPPFRFAIFLAGGPPFSPSPHHGADVTSLYISPNTGVMSGDIVTHTSLNEQREIEEGRAASTDGDAEGNAGLVRRYNAHVDDVRIDIPTAHVYGRNDVDVGKSEQLVELCEEGKRVVFVHGGGHDVPRTREVSQGIARAVERVEERGRMGW